MIPTKFITVHIQMFECVNFVNQLIQGVYTVWPENLTGIKFDEIASKLHNKNMTEFKFDEMLGKKAHSIRKININGY